MAKSAASGTVLKQGTTVVANITSIGVPSPEKPEIDLTDFASTAAENTPGIPDFGEIPISGFYNYSDAGQTILRADGYDVAPTTKAWTIEFTKQGNKFTFNGWVKRYTPTAGGPNEPYRFDATLRVTGAVTVAALP